MAPRRFAGRTAGSAIAGGDHLRSATLEQAVAMAMLRVEACFVLKACTGRGQLAIGWLSWADWGHDGHDLRREEGMMLQKVLY